MSIFRATDGCWTFFDIEWEEDGRSAWSHGWSIGGMGRLTFYRFGSDTPPAASSVGILPTLLLTFTR
jgi:hypothetical protein